jgi:hypothetical protein
MARLELVGESVNCELFNGALMTDSKVLATKDSCVLLSSFAKLQSRRFFSVPPHPFFAYHYQRMNCMNTVPVGFAEDISSNIS